MVSLKKMLKNKYLLLFGVVVILGVSVVGSCFCFMKTEDLIFKKDVTVTFRQEVYVSDLIQNLDGKLVEDYKIDTNVVGKKKLRVSYYNHYGFIESKSTEVQVVDVTAPIVVVSDVYTVEKGSISNLQEAIFCADDYDDAVVCEIEGDYDLEKVGNYNLKYSAHDHSGNYTNKEFVLRVKEKEKRKPSSGKETYTKFSDIYQQYKSEHTMIGLDLSKWQETVDFDQIKEQGTEFVMIKIGGQKKIQGEITMDPMFLSNIEKALDVGLKVGVYFYSYATSEKEARQQADWVIQNLRGYGITLPIAFDWENWEQYTSFHLSFHSLNLVAQSFLKRIEQRGYTSLLYSSKNYLENVWYQEEYTNWIAHYSSDSSGKDRYYMWQLCSDGKIDGIKGYVDIDVMYVKH